VIASVVTVFFAFNSAILWNQNLMVEKFLSGLNVELPRGARVMTYRPEVAKWPRVDVLLHAASYYGIFKGCVDIGNYETTLFYFPVHFKNRLPELPSQYQMAYEPETIDLTKYPSIQYLFGWEIEDKIKEKMRKNFHLIENNGPFSIWEINQPGF
jgi:hypothetical protein